MQRARMISVPLPKGTITKLVQREWGIERSYTTPDGIEICTPAPFESKEMKEETFKIMLFGET